MSLGINLAAIAVVTIPSTFAGAFECNLVMARSKCFQAVAGNVSQQDGGTSIGGVVFDNVDPGECHKLIDGCVTLYNERNGVTGYQAPDPDADPPDPGDEMVDQKCGSISEPSDSIIIGSFTNTNDQGKSADSWEIVATDTEGGVNEFSGTF